MMKEQSEVISDSSVIKGNTEHNATPFSYRELATSTNNFRQENLIGEGGFGSVYKGSLATGQIVAVKQLSHWGLQGDKEFLVEVLMLSLLHHPNLVSLIGYCAEGDQRLLVYQFMPGGSLEDRIHDLKPGVPPLDWDTRMRVAAGAAKGLDFLHNRADPPVIYRDLKSSNILLGRDFQPKLSDFGLAKFGPDKDKSYVTTRVVGTDGYCAPEYAGSGKLGTQSDVYSFGVVLLELITGQRPLDMKHANGKHTLVDWVGQMLKDRKELVNKADPLLRGKVEEWSLRRAMEIALMCVREEAGLRPSMKDVVDLLRTGENVNGDDRLCLDTGEGLINTPKDDCLEEMRLLSKDDGDRQLAVAEAKMWGKTCRDKRRQQQQKNDNCQT